MPYLPYKRWNDELHIRLFPQTMADGRRASDWASFDVSAREDGRILVLGDPMPDFPTPTASIPASFQQLQMSVELLARRPHPMGDLSEEFANDVRHMPALAKDSRFWFGWCKDPKECPYVALLCYLVLVARNARSENMGFYDSLRTLRQRSPNALIRKRIQTRTLQSLPKIFEKFDSWIKEHRPHLRFCAETRYYTADRNIGRLEDETIFGDSDLVALQRAAFEAGLGPESADLADLAARITARISPSEQRLLRILRSRADGAILECARSVIREWDGAYPDHTESANSPVSRSARALLQLELVFDPAAGNKPIVHLVFRGCGEVRGRLTATARMRETWVSCSDGDYVWNESEGRNLDIADQLRSRLEIQLDGSGTVSWEGFDSGPNPVTLRVFQPCEQPDIWRESRGLIRAPAGADAGRLVITTTRADLIEELRLESEMAEQNIDGVTVISVRATDKVRRLLEESGFTSSQHAPIRLVGGCRLGKGNRFYRHLPPEVHISGTDIQVEPEPWKGDWKQVEPGCFVADKERATGLRGGYYDFSCETRGKRRSLRVWLEIGETPNVRTQSAYRPLDSFARGTCQVAGFQLAGAVPSFESFDDEPTNLVKIGEMTEEQLLSFRRDAEEGRYRQGGAFVLGLLKARGSIDDRTFSELCTSIWSARHPDDRSPPHEAEVRRQREALAALGHAEYIDGKLRWVGTHAVVMPRLRRYDVAQNGSFVPRSVGCFIAGWTIADLIRIDDAAKTPEWSSRIRVVLHEQCPGAWAVPPRLVLLGPEDRKADTLLSFLNDIGVPACSPASIEGVCTKPVGLAHPPDVEPWAPIDERIRQDWEVYDPDVARWVSPTCFERIPFPWKQSIGLWAVRERVEERSIKYWRYYLVRSDGSGFAERALVSRETHSAAAWHAWVHWQKQRHPSSVLTSAAGVRLTCVPFNARPPWWLERVICGYSGFAAEWLTIKPDPAHSSARAPIAGYPSNTGNFMPSENSPRALQARLHGWRDLSEREARRLLWPFETTCNRPDLVQS